MSSQVVQVVQVELEAGRRCAECGTETARVDGRFTLRTRAETARPEGEMESVRSVKLNEGTGTKYVGARMTGGRSTVGADESNEKSQ